LKWFTKYFKATSFMTLYVFGNSLNLITSSWTHFGHKIAFKGIEQILYLAFGSDFKSKSWCIKMSTNIPVKTKVVVYSLSCIKQLHPKRCCNARSFESKNVTMLLRYDSSRFFVGIKLKVSNIKRGFTVYKRHPLLFM